MADGIASAADRKRLLVECQDCGLRHRIGALAPHHVARCGRCGGLLRAHGSLDACLALAVTGLALILLANFMPFMSLGMEGRVENASLASGALALAGQGLWPLSVLILLLTIAAPALKLGAITYVLGGLRMSQPPPYLVAVLRRLDQLSPWSMVEVYMLGIFVAYVKLAALATVTLGIAVYALAALMVAMAAMDVILDYDTLWEEVVAKGLVLVPPPSPGEKLARCATCGLLAAAGGEQSRCPRCDARLHRRKPDSFARCWALVVTAAILYVPANYYPIMTVISFGSGAPDTILSGVKHLVEAGMWPLALLVFFASITVPVLKIVGLGLLLVTSQRGSHWHLRDRTRLYRVIESVGRWSMIDIFMLSILVALVRLGKIATVVPDIGALAFASVVLTTMFAAMAFDPRLMWDSAGENR
ncbi:MAG TPA: paraquat-inducible protein A [Stellaceae bacterium]|nr:paraquat-inducible protein A [Stellaceae bacterium]